MKRKSRIAAMFIAIMFIISGCKDNTEIKSQPHEKQNRTVSSANDLASSTVFQQEQKDPLSSLFALQPCQKEHPISKNLDVTFSLPEQQQQKLEGIQAISVRKLNDDAGYGSRFGSSFALDQEGRVYAWGQRFEEWRYGSSSYPRLVTGLPKMKQISGEFALTPDGNVWFMNGTNPPFAIKGLSGVTSISEVGNDVLSAVTNDEQLWIWWPEMDERKEALRKIDKAKQVKAVYGDLYRVYWIDSEGTAWHESVNWQPTVFEPKKIPLPAGEKAEQVYTTFSEDYIMTTNKKIYQISYDLKVELTTLKQVEQIAATNERQYYLKPDGTVWEKHLHDLPAEKEPVQIDGLQNIVDIQAGMDHVLALSADGTVYSWGSNMYGQLGRYPHFFERFTSIGKLKGIQDVQTFADDIRFVHEGDVWKINNRMEVEPFLLNRQVVKLFMDHYLLADGTFLIDQGPDQCYQLRAKEPIRDIVRDGNGWIAKLDSGELYKVELLNNIGSVQKVHVRGNQQPRVKQMLGYPFFTILTEDGSVYFKQYETDSELWMEQVRGLPPIREWSTLDYTYFDGFASVVRALDDKGNAYSIKISNSNSKFEPQLLAKNVEHLYGGLLQFSNGDIMETGLAPFNEKSLQERRWPNLSNPLQQVKIETILTRYSYPIEGPSSLKHMLIGEDGTLMIYGHSPFFRYDDKPSPVIVPR